MKFRKIIEQSKAIGRFAELENMDESDLYSFLFEAYCNYMDMFKERLKYGREINRILSAYKHIEAFKVATPRELVNRMFISELMQNWFAYRIWAEIDKQVRTKTVDRNELMTSVVFMSAIPKGDLMERILNEKTEASEKENRGGDGAREKERTAGAKAKRTVETT